MDKSVYNMLMQFFNSDNQSLLKFYVIVKKTNINALIDTLFSFISTNLDNYDDKNNFNVVLSAINFLNILIDSNNNEKINKKKVLISLKNIVRKINNIRNSELFCDKTTLYKNVGKLEQGINKVIETIDNIEIKNYNQYTLIKYIIDETRNIDYLEQTFICLKDSVNSVDKDGNSLFYNILKKCIDIIINYGKSGKRELLYYSNILEVIKKNAEFNNKDKKKCISLIKKNLGSSDIKKGDYYKQRAFNTLKNIVNNNFENDNTVDKLAMKYNIHINFNKDIINELKKVKDINEDKKEIIDDYIISIDSDSCTEIDDSLSAKILPDGTYLLGVHIASPLAYISYDSYMVEEAIKRASSIYLPKSMKFSNKQIKNCITLFPEEFSKSIVSLNQDQNKYAKSYYFKIDKEGNIVNEIFLKTIIKNKVACSFNKANKILEFGDDNYELYNTLSILQKISELISKNLRPEQIYLDRKDKNLNPEELVVGNSISEKIVNNIMIFTGKEVANFFYENSYPTLYRIHNIDTNQLSDLKKEIDKTSIVNKEEFNRLYSTLLNLYPKASYDTKGSHTGLNLQHYCHCTSPIRRAADIVVENSLDVCYFGNPSDKEIYNLENSVNKAKNIINKSYSNNILFLEQYNNLKTKVKK